MLWNTSWVDLCVARVSEVSTVAVHLHSSRTVRCHRVGRKEESITITTSSYNHSVTEVTLDAASNEVTSDDTTSAVLAVLVLDHNYIQHLVAVVHLHFAFTDLAAECRVSTEEELLTCLTLSIESTRYLCATERTVVEQAAVFASERNTLSHTLVDDAVAHLSKTVHVCLTSTVVTTLDSVVEEAIHRVAIVLVVLSRVDTTLCSDRVCTTWRVLDTEVEDIEAHLCERSRSRCTSQTSTNYDDVKTTFVGRVDQLLMVFVIGPFLLEWTSRDLRHFRRNNLRSLFFCCHISIKLVQNCVELCRMV